MATTPCPHCGAAVRVPKEDVGTCPSCHARLRFLEVPERSCACGVAVALPPGEELVTCPACGRRMAADPRRRVVHTATCPRCRRRIPVDAESATWRCPHCEAALTLHDTV